MSTDTQSLIEAIRESPDSDHPRLVYGDRLIERGDPSGELIAVQCSLAKLPPDARERRKLTVRQNQLLKALAAAYGEGWKYTQGELEYSHRVDDFYRDREKLRCRFSRGFIDQVDTHFNVLEASIAWLVENAPLLASLRVRPYRGRVSAAPMIALLQRLPALGSLGFLYCEQTVELVRELCTNERFSRLRSLSLEPPSESSRFEVVELLARSEVLAGLQTLDLYTYGLSADDVRPLADAHFELRTLLLNASALGVEGAQVLASAPALNKLEVLGLYKNGLEAAGVEALAGSSHLGNLVSLDLRSNRIGRAGAEALGATKNLPSLRTLVLVGNTLDAAAVAALCGSERVGLRELNLQHTRLADDAIDGLTTASEFCQGLRLLNLRSNKLGDDAAQRLADCASLEGLLELDLGGNSGIGQRGVDALRASRYLTNATIKVGRERIKPSPRSRLRPS